MMRKIFKYILDQPDGETKMNEPFEIEMPWGAKILTADIQKRKILTGSDLVVWAEIEEDAPIRKATFLIMTTGAPIPKQTPIDNMKYVSTVKDRDDRLIMHVYVDLPW